MIEEVAELGTTVEQRWRAANYGESAFADICARTLGEFRLHERVSVWDSVGLALGRQTLPEQRDPAGRFGNPPITLWTSARFHVDLYFWLDGTTSIHQHAFCGAFQVLLGSSCHCEYRFQPTTVINGSMEIGQLDLCQVELLQLGDVREIQAGRTFIHSLFHLDHPSVTLVVRTSHARLNPPQFEYRKPHLAIDPFFQESHLTKQLQVVKLLYQARRADADDRVIEFIADADFQTTYTVLNHVRGLVQPNLIERHLNLGPGAERLERMLETVRARHGALADLLPSVFAQQDAVSEIARRRAFVTDAGHRFFLALLLNVAGRDEILRLVKHRYPNVDPITKVLKWVSDLGNIRGQGTQLPNALGIPEFTEHDVTLINDLINDVQPEPTTANMQRVDALTSNLLVGRLLAT